MFCYFESRVAVIRMTASENEVLLAHLFKIPQSLSGNCGDEEELRNYGYCSF